MKIIRKGSRGEAVKLLQERLIAKGFRPGRTDGIFGSGTDRAVRQFQAAHNLKVDGIVGDQTWALLLARDEIEAPPSVLDEQKAWLRDQVPAAATQAQKAVLEAAIATFGWREQPDGSNDGPEVGQISSGYYAPADEQRLGKPPWCALAVSYWLKEGLGAASYEDIPFGGRFGAVSQITAWAKKRGRYAVARASTTVAPGTIFTMGRGGSGSDPSAATRAGHTGLVVADIGSHVITIEGNSSNKVMSRKRRKTSLHGFVRWW